MSKKSQSKGNDFFQQLMQGVKPLIKDKIRLSSQKKTQRPAPTKTNYFQPIIHCEDKELGLTVHSDESLSYKQTSISYKIFQKLRKGQYPIEASLDLHGKSVVEAKAAVEDFLSQCLENQIKNVLIIHGKGLSQPKPILKNKLNNWLQHLHVVLAFCSARARHGGNGAVYVMLKTLP